MIRKIRPICFLYIFIFTFISLKAQNNAPVVSINFAHVDVVNQKLEINYKLSDMENDASTIWLKYSKDGGDYYDSISIDKITGSYGANLLPGTSYYMWWSYAGQVSNIYNTKLRLFASDNKSVDISEMVKLVDENRLKNSVMSINGIRHLATQPTFLNQIRDTIDQKFNNYGFQTERQDFSYSSYTGQNITGRLAGVKDEANTIIIDAHYDGVAGSPAADDNASGVAGMLEAARILKNYRFEHSIRFIGFDFEEAGLIGSQRYVQSNIKPYEKIDGVLNFEMIGFYSDKNNSQTVPAGFDLLLPKAYQELVKDTFKGNFIVVCGNTASKNLNQAYIDNAKAYVPELKFLSVELPGNSEIAPDFRRSDHTPFWENGNQALLLTDGSNFRNPNYHKSSDTEGTLNYTFMKNVVKAALATAAKLAIPSSTGYTELDLVTLSAEPLHRHLENLQVKIYPNPTEGLLNFTLVAHQNFDCRVDIYNLEGKVVFTRVVEIKEGKSNELDLSDLSKGNYMIHFTAKQGEYSQSIMIQ